MTLAAAALIAVVVGSLPTADWLARAVGIDLRAQGSRNPGARNAVEVGGPGLGASVLVMELLKGAAATGIGRLLATDAGGAAAAVGAVAGNVYNPWFRFRGGKGLGITGGTLVALWPQLVPVLAALLALVAATRRRSGPAALATLGVYVTAAVIGMLTPLPTGWGLSRPGWITVAAIGSAVVMAPKHVADTVTPAGRPPSPA